MKRIKILLSLALALCLLLSCLPAALAEDPAEPQTGEETGSVEPAEGAEPVGDEAFEEDERFTGKSWDEVVEAFLQSWATDPKYVGLGYYNTVTGEEHYLNPDEYRITASMYKVPLNMVFAERVANGEMDWDTSVSGYPYEVALEQTIVHSNNDIARNMVKWELGKGNWQAGRRVIAPYCGLDPENVDWKFQENNYSTPRQMIYCLRLLYENPDRFPRIVETMQRAEPTEYFKRREQRFNIAHKYGFLQDGNHLYMNDCGIAFTDDPILLVAFTDNNLKAYDVLTEYCTLMCDYAQYHHALRLKEEAEAERQRLEAERLEAERLEAERRQAEEEARAAEQERLQAQVPEVTQPPAADHPAEEPTAAPAPTPGPEKQSFLHRAEQLGLSQTALICAGAVLLVLLAALVIFGVVARRFRVNGKLFQVLALLLCLAALGRILWPAFGSIREEPSGDPAETVLNFFDALAAEDYERAYACLDGVESLGLEYAPQRVSLQALRGAMRSQFSAELYGSCSISGERAYQQVNCRFFDVDKLDREARGQAMLYLSRYASSHSVGELYNENGNYRPELLREAWDHAVLELLQEPENYRSSGGVQLELHWSDGTWRIVPNEKLLQLLSGGLRLTEKEGSA